MNDKRIGFVRKVDKQGRVLIPMEIRMAMGIITDAELEIIPCEGGFLIRTYRKQEVNDFRKALKEECGIEV